jgi:beta-lactamase class D
MKKLLCLILLIINLVSCSKKSEIYLKSYFDEFGVEGCFVLYDLMNNKYHIYNSDRANTRFYPASTFKILNTISALESKVAQDENFFLKWDGVSGVIPSHKQDHTLKLAFQNSTLWFYQEIARRIGLEQMQEIVNKVNFGNKDIGKEVDQFWLEGPLKISALEYIEFFKGIHLKAFAFDKETYVRAKKIFIEQQTQDYTLRAKTGTTVFEDEQFCWYVGYIERTDNVYFFAMNVSSERPENFLEGKAVKARVPLTKMILEKEFKLLRRQYT